MRRGTIDMPLALALGFVPVAVLDVGVTLARAGIEPEVRAWHLAYLIGYRAALALGLALLAAALARVLVALPSRPWLAGPIVAALVVGLSIAGGAFAFADDLRVYLPLPRIGLTIVLSLLPAALVGLRLLAGALLARRAGRAAPRPRGRARAEQLMLRLPFAAVGVGAAVLNHLVAPFGNPGLHLGLLVAAGVSLGMALLGLGLPPRTRRARGGAQAVVTALLAAWALWSLIEKPPSRVSTELARNDSAGLYAFVATLDPGDDEVEPAPDLAWLARFAGAPHWFMVERGLPPVAPSRPLVDPARVIVILITIDALRQDVFAGPSHAATMPNLQALRAESTVFSRGYASASSTAPSIASIFTGRYLSELYWTPTPFMDGQRLRYYPVEDHSPRLPELLPEAVRSFNLPSTERLRQEYALIRGMDEEAETDTEEHLLAAEVLPILGDWVGRLGAEPGFAYVHLMDGHAPYTSAGHEGPAFERYVRELGRADAQLGEFIAELRREGLWSRTVLIVAADHGEAFGEHGHTQHGGSLYEEQIRVPILIRVPGRAARVVDQRVSLVDLGPTILDLFQQPTPGDFQGQSLVPLIAGRDVVLDRPIVMESNRLHRAIIFRDGVKCIWRSREDQFELYDLNRDPRELDNIIDTDPSAPDRIAAVRQFFRAHELVRPGYTVPYW